MLRHKALASRAAEQVAQAAQNCPMLPILCCDFIIKVDRAESWRTLDFKH